MYAVVYQFKFPSISEAKVAAGFCSESLGGKMNRLVITSDKKKVIIEDNHLFDLPFNTIYEIDLDKLKRGIYFVELYTHNHEIIRKEITIL